MRKLLQLQDDNNKAILFDLELSDVQFNGGGETFSAHLNILRSLSPAFYSLCDGMPDPLSISFPTEFVSDPKIFEEVLHFVYTDQLNKSYDNCKSKSKDKDRGKEACEASLVALLKASNYLGVITLKLTVEAKLCALIGPSNCAILIDVAERLTAPMLLD